MSVRNSVASFGETKDIDTQAFRTALSDDGVVVLRRLFDAAEIENMRNIVRSHLVRSGRRFSLGRTQPNAVSKVQALEFLYAHPKVLAAFEIALGPGNIVFTGHSDIHMNMLSGWHKDSGESVGGYFEGNYFEADDCKVYKVAVYLQDHTEEDGLTVRLGSHRTSAMQEGPAVHIRSQAGDALIFDVRLTHIGQIPNPLEKSLMRLSLALNGGDRTRQDNPVISGIKAAYWRAAQRRDRMSIFFTYGADNSYTYQFARANMERQNAQAALTDATIPAPLAKTLGFMGVRVYGHQSRHIV